MKHRPSKALSRPMKSCEAYMRRLNSFMACNVHEHTALYSTIKHSYTVGPNGTSKDRP